MRLEIEDKKIVDIVFITDRDLPKCIEMIFVLEDACSKFMNLQISVDSDTDELVICSDTKAGANLQNKLIQKEDAAMARLRASLVGKVIGTYWVANNHKGYFDLFALGIGELIPNFIVSCAASCLVFGPVQGSSLYRDVWGNSSSV